MLRRYIMKLYKCLYYSDLYNSTVSVEGNVRFHNTLSISLIVICLVINLAINVVRFLQLYYNNVDMMNILYFNFMYFNSVQVYMTELQFILLAYGLMIRFQDINIYLYEAIRQNSIFYNLNYRKEYLYARMLVHDFTKKPPVGTIFKTPHFSSPSFPTSFSDYSLNLKCNTIANLRIAHIFLCDSLSYLNAIYDYSIIFALVCLFITTLLDIYYEFFGIKVTTEVGHTQIRTYLWIVQYALLV
uniref:Gustatory receptor n=1 Tax=Cacopsylla melanoneura TaxID=428564 RepID=A0A8D8X7J5_9HEMI